MKYITILDFSDGTVNIHKFDEDAFYKDGEIDYIEVLEHFGHRIQDCEYMITEKLKLQIHE